MRDIRRIPQLILWYRLLHAKMFRKLFHFYGTVWIVSAGLVSISLVMLFQQGPEATSRYGPDWIWIIGCVFALCWGYGIAKIFGSVEVNIFSVVVPALVLGMPEAGGDLNSVVPSFRLFKQRDASHGGIGRSATVESWKPKSASA